MFIYIYIYIYIYNVVREKINVKNSVLDNIRYKKLNWYGHVRRMNEERLLQEQKEDLEIRKYEETTGMRKKGINNGMDRQRRMEKEDKTLGTEGCENMNSAHKNKFVINIIYLYMYR